VTAGALPRIVDDSRVIAVAPLAQRVAPAGSSDIGTALALPPLPHSKAMLYSRVSDARARAVLSVVAAAFRGATGK
jgi:hypothetical protein